MQKAVSVLNIIKSFIEFTNAYCNGQMGDTRFEIDEIELFGLLEQTRLKIDDALNDDFNTSVALNELLSLISSINKIYKTKKENSTEINSNYGALMGCLKYIQFILDTFGLKLETSNEQTNDTLNVSF
jgi:cysteinyl-tRNA synthetase